MNVTRTDPIGARVEGLAVGELRAGEAEELKDLLAEHGVLVLGEQGVGDPEFLGFLRSLGELAFTEGETAAEGFPDLNVVSNVGRETPPKSSFHVDTSYIAVPPAYTSLRAVEIPESGGETLFTNQYRAAETLPSELGERIEGRTIRHVLTGVEVGPDAETEADHPILRPHPRTGRVALYLSTPKRCAAISGIDDDEAAGIIARLLEHSTREENTFRHSWAPGDVVIWDNGCVLHRADHSAVSGDRVMHRGMVAGPAAGA